ncbi:MAG: protein-L-isoaspartate(D-aspartate) O-methyltransferase [Ardenticatenaceae bacterium]|nr:protein-L-isoaspartate(D-aspartate) O-methyltransferase [Ardenticatenaceae bacterium]
MAPHAATNRTHMVSQQLANRGIGDEAVLQAMGQVPRHLFVPPEYTDLTYEDSPLPLSEGQTISQPYMVAYMTELLELTATDKVLEIGTGSGYAAAVMSQIAAEVYTMERHELLVAQATATLAALAYDNVTVRLGDGTRGWPDEAPFAAIVAAAGGYEIPEPLLTQLAVNGRLVMPIGTHPHTQQLQRVRRLSKDDYRYELLGGVRFVPLIGEGGWQADVLEERGSDGRPSIFEASSTKNFMI